MTWTVCNVPKPVHHDHGYAQLTVPLVPGEYEYKIVLPSKETVKHNEEAWVVQYDSWKTTFGGHHYHGHHGHMVCSCSHANHCHHLHHGHCGHHH